MSVQAIAWVWEHSKAEGTNLLVLLAIANHADAEGENAWPGVALISRRIKRDRRVVQRALRALQESGELEIQIQAGGNANTAADRRPNLYRFPGVALGGPIERGGVPAAPSGERGGADDAPGAVETTQRGGAGAALTVLEPSTNRPNNVTIEEWAVAEGLANHLADLIHRNGSRRPNVTKVWISDIEKMIRIDGVTADRVKGAIEWSQGHSFWSMNILSPKKLRQHYERMRLQSIQERRSRPSSPVDRPGPDREQEVRESWTS